MPTCCSYLPLDRKLRKLLSEEKTHVATAT